MQYLILVLVVVAMTINSIAQKQYNLKAKRQNIFLFMAVFILVAMMFFVVSSGFKLNFNMAVLPYSIAFATVYSLSLLTGFLAIKYGPLSITMLVIAYSLIIPTFYGMIFLNEKIGALAYVGIAMIMISLLLVNFLKKSKAGERDGDKPQGVSLKWILILVCAFFVNGLNSVVQKEQQMRFDGAYKNEFMIVGLLLSSVVLFTCAFIGDGRKEFLPKLKESVPYGFMGGIANGVMNLGVLVLTGAIPNAILFPSISGGGVVLGFLVSVFIYKEKLSPVQVVGFVIGTASVIILNL